MNWEDKSLQSDCPIRSADSVHHRDLDLTDRLETFFCLIPVIGLIPSLWTIYRQQSHAPEERLCNRKKLAVCRLSVLLALSWVTIYLSCNVGADLSGTSTSIGLRLLFINSLTTSGYFVSSLWLMMLLWQQKSVRLSGLSYLAEQTVLPSTDNFKDR
jgi:hypothetical protein